MTESQKLRKTQKTNLEVMNALSASGGVIADAAKILKLSSSTSLRERIKHDDELSAHLEKCREDLDDVARDNVRSAIHEKDMATTRWYLASHDPNFQTTIHTKISGSLTIQYDLKVLSLDELKLLESLLEKAASVPSGN